jgi:DNA-binding GntR family transcriptional regulator
MGSEQDTAVAYSEHMEIVNALRRRNADELAYLTRAHLEASKASIEAELNQPD